RYSSASAFHIRSTSMKRARLIVSLTCAIAAFAATAVLRAGDDNTAREPNYPLAARWTVAKFNKLVFDVQVTPHWLEFSDRFWYSYEARDGKKYYLVDPKVARGTKAPLFDAAQMAAKLASATLVPMDAQHLPIKAIKFINKDAALQLEVEVPKDADIPGLKK